MEQHANHGAKKKIMINREKRSKYVYLYIFIYYKPKIKFIRVNII